MRTIFLLISLILFTNCQTTKSIRFSQKENEIVTNQNLKTFLANTKNPKIVLRVPYTSKEVTENDKNTYLYNAIEHEFLKNGFIVRDRQLFNQIIANSENNLNYEVLKQKSDTELIIELSQLRDDIIYETNQYYDGNNKIKVEKDIFHKKAGAMVEFKVIIVKNNEYAGVYKFHYSPCSVEPCVISLSIKDYEKLRKAQSKSEPIPVEIVNNDVMEDFIRRATQQLINEMRK